MTLHNTNFVSAFTWHADSLAFTDARTGEHPPANMRIVKKSACRLLDGKEHNEFTVMHANEVAA